MYESKTLISIYLCSLKSILVTIPPKFWLKIHNHISFNRDFKAIFVHYFFSVCLLVWFFAWFYWAGPPDSGIKAVFYSDDKPRNIYNLLLCLLNNFWASYTDYWEVVLFKEFSLLSSWFGPKWLMMFLRLSLRLFYFDCFCFSTFWIFSWSIVGGLECKNMHL